MKKYIKITVSDVDDGKQIITKVNNLNNYEVLGLLKQAVLEYEYNYIKKLK